MLNLKEYRDDHALLTDYLPWACLVAPSIVLNKEGAFQTSFRYRGPDLESASGAELVAITARVNNVLRRLGSGWVLFFEAARERAANVPLSAFNKPAAWLVEQERSQTHSEPISRYESTYFLTLLWLPPSDTAGRAERALIERIEDPGDQLPNSHLETFQTQAARVFDLLETCFAEITWLGDSETLTYLHSCVSTKRHTVTVPETPAYLDDLLADEPLTGGLEPMLGDHHIRALTLLGFPGSTTPGLLDELNRQGFAYRWSTRFIALDKSEAEKIISKKRRHWFAKRKSIGAILRETLFNEQAALVDNDADNKAADADAALQALGSDLVSFGYMTTTITVFDKDREQVENKLRQVDRIVTGRGFTAIRESLNCVEAWLGSLPGHAYANVREPMVHSLNLAHLAPLSAVWAGESYNRHLNGPALVEARTHATTPFRLNLHVGDVGHTMIVGPTGAGKSVLLAFLALQWQRYADAQIFVFDKGGSSRAAILAMQGQHISFSEEQRPGLQPLRQIDHATERSFAADWLAGLCIGQDLQITPDLKTALWDALQALASAPEEERTLTGLSLMLQSQDLKSAIAPYTLEGAYGKFLDGARETLSLSDCVCFEMEELMQSPDAARPIITYLFRRLESRFDGSPTLLILDEAWLFLDDPLFSARLREWLKTLRKKNVAVVFATQSLADISNSPIAPALIESCPTRIFLPNERASEPQSKTAYEQFGLNSRQIDIVSSATPKRDYYYQSPLGCRLFDLELGPIALAFCGSSARSDQALIDKVSAAASTREFAAEFLRAKTLSWAADLLADASPPERATLSQIAAE